MTNAATYAANNGVNSGVLRRINASKHGLVQIPQIISILDSDNDLSSLENNEGNDFNFDGFQIKTFTVPIPDGDGLDDGMEKALM